ncbi:MAG: type IV secretion system protein [Proteobacteria bacterium]|nr:type IV secretion system protein [Pseudomonadota bacterium]
MAGACPVPAPEDPLVRGMLTVVDCNVQQLVRSGYASLFEPSGAFSAVLTSLLTIFVAIFGYRLLLGRAQLRISDLALTMIKLGAVLALATRWDLYQGLVYNALFQGPAQLASGMLGAVQPEGSAFRGDVFDGLQRAFDHLTFFAGEYAKQVPTTAAPSPLLGGVGFGAMALTLAATTLLLASLGVLLAAKVVLALLLAIGPIFIVLLLFDATRGVFEGWLRASLAFAFAPLAVTLLLGVALTMLEPVLLQMNELRAQNLYPLGPVYSVLLLALVFAGVSAGLIVAGGMIATGFKLPQRRDARGVEESGAGAADAAAPAQQTRAARVAAAAASADRREAFAQTPRGFVEGPRGSTSLAQAFSNEGGVGAGSDRRTTIVTAGDRGASASVAPPESRLGQSSRRRAQPRPVRDGVRSAS